MLYSLHLPEGISVLNGNHWNIYGNTEFTLVSDNIPDVNDRFLIFCPLMWGIEPRQYSPESGDNSSILLLLSICLLSAITIIVSIISKYNKKS